MPNVCQRTTSVSAMLADGLAAIHWGRPMEGVPEVWGTCRPAGWIWESVSVGRVSFGDCFLASMEGKVGRSRGG